jgi:hypothetical protein
MHVFKMLCVIHFYLLNNIIDNSLVYYNFRIYMFYLMYFNEMHLFMCVSQHWAKFKVCKMGSETNPPKKKYVKRLDEVKQK